MLTKLAEATYPDGSIPDVDTVCRMATFVFAAGQDTTARLITAALRIIADDPEIQAYLRADAERIPNFVEEVLRHDGVVRRPDGPPVRTTTIAGVEIPAGTSIAIFPSAANRDPARFEEPDEFRPDRPNANEHLAFGRGIHACPGGPLSRIEARVSHRAVPRPDLATSGSIRVVHGPRRRPSLGVRADLHPARPASALHLVLTPAEDRVDEPCRRRDGRCLGHRPRDRRALRRRRLPGGGLVDLQAEAIERVAKELRRRSARWST